MSPNGRDGGQRDRGDFVGRDDVEAVVRAFYRQEAMDDLLGRSSRPNKATGPPTSRRSPRSERGSSSLNGTTVATRCAPTSPSTHDDRSHLRTSTGGWSYSRQPSRRGSRDPSPMPPRSAPPRWPARYSSCTAPRPLNGVAVAAAATLCSAWRCAAAPSVSGTSRLETLVCRANRTSAKRRLSRRVVPDTTPIRTRGRGPEQSAAASCLNLSPKPSVGIQVAATAGQLVQHRSPGATRKIGGVQVGAGVIHML